MRRWDRPARIHRRRRRWNFPSDPSDRTRSRNDGRGRPCRSHRCPAPRDRRAHRDCTGCRRPDSPPSPHGCDPAAARDRGPEIGWPRYPAFPPSARIWTRRHVPSRAAAGRPATIRRPVHGRVSPVRSRCSPACLRWACACSSAPARARPRSRPCRRGNCHRRDSRAAACSTDAGSRCPAVWPPARCFRPAAPPPRGHPA